MVDMDTIKNIIQDNGALLYDTEVVTEGGSKIFRIYITAKNGVTLNTCGKIASIISPILDLNPPTSGAYTLEVSSPGIERSLKKSEHFYGSIGETVKVKLINTDKIIGKLESFDGKILVLSEEDGEVIKIDLEDIDKARTYYKW